MLREILSESLLTRHFLPGRSPSSAILASQTGNDKSWAGRRRAALRAARGWECSWESLKSDLRLVRSEMDLAKVCLFRNERALEIYMYIWVSCKIIVLRKAITTELMGALVPSPLAYRSTCSLTSHFFCLDSQPSQWTVNIGRAWQRVGQQRVSWEPFTWLAWQPESKGIKLARWKANKWS